MTVTEFTLGRVSQRRQVTALLASAHIWETARVLDPVCATDPANGGRRRRYPIAAAVVWNCLVPIFGSSRQVEVELACPDSGWWPLIREAAQAHGCVFPVEPMRRHHFEHLSETYLTSDTAIDLIRSTFRQVAATQATEIGLCTTDGGGSWTHPSPNRVIAGDGKVVTPRYRAHPRSARTVDTETGEVTVRKFDPDADTHVTGGGTRALGTKFTLLSTRGDTRNQRVVLDVAHVPKNGNEAKTAFEAIGETVPLLPGCQAVVYDGAARGVHHRQVLKTLGVHSISKMHSAQHGNVPDRHYGPADVRRPDGTIDTVDIHLVNGLPHVREIAADGTPLTTPTERTTTLRRRHGTGWRWYNEYTVPDVLGGGTLRLRLDQTDDDLTRQFNREEHLRTIPPDDPDHRAIYGRRNDTESGNRLLDDSMLRERAHTVGWRRQTLDIIGWAAGRNAVAHQHHRRTVDPPIEPAA